MNNRKVIVILYSQDTKTSAYVLANYINSKSKILYAVLVSENDYDSNLKIIIRDFLKRITFQTSRKIYKRYYDFKDILFKKRAKKIEKKETQNNYEIHKKINKDDIKKYKILKKLQNMLLRYNPHGILCMTHSACEKMLRVKKMLELDSLRIFGMVTDYNLDDRFIDENVYGYFVQNKRIKDKLEAKNFDFNFIEAVGTPLFDTINDIYDRTQTMKELGVEVIERPNILVTTGKMGTAELKDIAFKLANSNVNANFLFNTCENQAVKNILKIIFKKDKLKRFYTISKIEDMAKLYSIVDIAITSPTAIMTYELFVRCIPAILIRGIKFSDKSNYRYLVANNMGYGLENEKELVTALKMMLESSDFALSFIKAAKSHERLDTKKLVYDKLLETVIDYDGVMKEFEEKHYVLDDADEEETKSLIEVDEEIEIIRK